MDKKHKIFLRGILFTVLAMLIFVPMAQATLAVVSEFSQESARGARGFGHTGKQ